MPGTFTPQNVQDDFYNKYQNIKNYKSLVIKENKTTDNLKHIFKNNIWDLENKFLEMKKINKSENNNYFNSWINEIYLLDYKKKPKMKEINKNDFYEMKYKGDMSERNEKNYISHFKTWINNFLLIKMTQ
jgi:hypothetical protein